MWVVHAYVFRRRCDIAWLFVWLLIIIEEDLSMTVSMSTNLSIPWCLIMVKLGGSYKKENNPEARRPHPNRFRGISASK